MPDLATKRYRKLVQHVPRPSHDQIEGFARFLANDHSWYKHLPMDGPGEPFFLYIDPHAHALLRETANGDLAWRMLVREHNPGSPFHSWHVDMRPGDVDPQGINLLQHDARGKSTSEYREQLGHWRYWNFGPPGQPRDQALRDAAESLRIGDDKGNPLQVPQEALDLGLVYLRATVSGYMGPNEDEYEQLREQSGLPTAEDDQAEQFEAMFAAMRRVVAWAYQD